MLRCQCFGGRELLHEAHVWASFRLFGHQLASRQGMSGRRMLVILTGRLHLRAFGFSRKWPKDGADVDPGSIGVSFGKTSFTLVRVFTSFEAELLIPTC